MTRRFSEPWTVQSSESAFWVEDAEGHRFGYTYFEERPQTGLGPRPHILTKDEARRIVTNFAKLPTLLKG